MWSVHAGNETVALVQIRNPETNTLFVWMPFCKAGLHVYTDVDLIIVCRYVKVI